MSGEPSQPDDAPAAPEPADDRCRRMTRRRSPIDGRSPSRSRRPTTIADARGQARRAREGEEGELGSVPARRGRSREPPQARRSARLEDAKLETKGKVLKEMLPVVDNLERAIEHADASGRRGDQADRRGRAARAAPVHDRVRAARGHAGRGRGQAVRSEPARGDLAAGERRSRRAPSCRCCSAATSSAIGCCGRRSSSSPKAEGHAETASRRVASAMARVIGIDLGTTNSCVAVMDGDAPVVIANSEGARTTPSVVGFAQSGERLVGQVARRQAMTNAENTIYAVKRLMGRKFDDAEVQRHLLTCPVRDRRRPTTATPTCVVRGRDYSPPEISRDRAAARCGRPPRTGSASRSPRRSSRCRRTSTTPSARRPRTPAGSPGSTSCASSTSRPRRRSPTASRPQGAQRVAVYDLGGGTFDISILELDNGVFRVRSTAGDTFLGGEDFDNAIVEYLLDDVRRSRTAASICAAIGMALQRLKEAAERAKIELSSALPDRDQPAVHRGRLRRAAPPRRPCSSATSSSSWSSRCVQRTLEPCRRALADAGLSAERHRRR